MSDRIAAAEAILATLATARGRVSSLASAHLPFDRALAIELRATVGASAERAQLALVNELVDRRLAALRGARAVPPPPPIISLPVSTAPVVAELDREDVGDEATPMSASAGRVVPVAAPVEPEPEVTAAQVEATLPSVGGPVELEPEDQPSAEPVEVVAEELGEEPDEDIEAVVLEESEIEEAMVEEESEAPPVQVASPEPEPAPASFDHLVRFVEPGPRATELLFDEGAEEPPQGAGEEAEDELLSEAVESALDEASQSEGTGEVLELAHPVAELDEESSAHDAPTTMDEPYDGVSEEGVLVDGGTEEMVLEDEEPPMAPPVRTPTVVAVGGNEIDDERTLYGVPVLTGVEVEDDEPAPPPRRGGAVAQARGRDAAAQAEADTVDLEEASDDELSPVSGAGFSVTLERPDQTDEEDEPVFELGASAQSDAPRLTDEDEGYSVSASAESPSEPVEIDHRLAAEFVQKARDAEARGDLSKAIVHYQDLLDLTPESLEAWLGRGRCFMEMGDYAAAMSDFQRAEDLDQKSPEPLVEMGNLFFARKEYRRAIEFYDHAIELDPTHAMARCRRGICHHYRKNHKQAFQDLQRAYSLNPDIPNIRKYVQMAVKAMEKAR